MYTNCIMGRKVKVNRLTTNSEYKNTMMNSFLLAFICTGIKVCKFGKLEQNACKSKCFNIYVNLRIIAIIVCFDFVSTLREIAKDILTPLVLVSRKSLEVLGNDYFRKNVKLGKMSLVSSHLAYLTPASTGAS